MERTTLWASLISVTAAILLALSDRGNAFFLAERGTPHGVIVQMFEWPFKDISQECTYTLGPNGFAGVQVSPITEHVVLTGRPWEERYEPVSYKISTRLGTEINFREMIDTCGRSEINYKSGITFRPIMPSRLGTETEFRQMIDQCGRSEIKVYVEVILNHMTKEYPNEMETTAGSKFDSSDMSYPSLSYTKEHFHKPCSYDEKAHVLERKDYVAMRDCRVKDRNDLDHTKYHVLCEISKFLNSLIEMGVAGFSIDSAKHMPANDLKAIFARLDYLSSYTGFVYDSKPFLYQDITEHQIFSFEDYLKLGSVNDYRYSVEINRYFNGEQPLKFIKDFKWHIPSEQAVVFVDNQLTERELIKGIPKSLNYENPVLYNLALVFLLAWPHGTPKIFSGYKFNTPEEGPSSDDEYSALASNGVYCGYKWTCVHRYREVAKMLEFRKVVQSAPHTNWWNHDSKNQIAFGRGDRGYVAINLEPNEMDEELQTGLEPGSYCDVLSGDFIGFYCKGKIIIVDDNGNARIRLDGKKAIAIHAWSRIRR